MKESESPEVRESVPLDSGKLKAQRLDVLIVGKSGSPEVRSPIAIGAFPSIFLKKNAEDLSF